MYHSVNPQTVESAFSWLHASQSGQSVSKLASQSASQSVSQPFSKSVGQLVSQSVIQSVSQSVSQSLASWAVSHSASKSVGQPAWVSQSVSDAECTSHNVDCMSDLTHSQFYISSSSMWKSWELWTKLQPQRQQNSNVFMVFKFQFLQNFEREFSD